MNKYTDIEIQTAKNLLKKGYKWIARNKFGRLYAHAAKPRKVNTYWWSVGNIDHTCDYVPIFQSVCFDDKKPTSLEAIVHPQILNDEEKRYLNAVIKPFRNRVESICKVNYNGSKSCYQYLFIIFRDVSLIMDLPVFEKDTMYKGMEPDRKYSVKELDL